MSNSPRKRRSLYERAFCRFPVSVGRPQTTRPSGSSRRCSATIGAISSDSGCSPCRSRSSRMICASSRSRMTPARPFASASSTVANNSRARSSSRGDPNETVSDTSSQLSERLAARSALPATERSLARSDSRWRVRSSSAPSVDAIASSVLCPGCNSSEAGSQSTFVAWSANSSSSTVLPTPRSPVTRILACCSGAALSIAAKRRNGASRPAR